MVPLDLFSRLVLLSPYVLFVALLLIGIIRYQRSHRGEDAVHAAGAVWPAALGLAMAISNAFIGAWFVVMVSLDEVIKGILRLYTPTGGGVDALLIAIVVGDLALILVASGRYRATVSGDPRPRRRTG